VGKTSMFDWFCFINQTYASLFSLYAETGWEKRNTTRKIRKLSLFFYNIVKGDTPESDLLPRTVNQANNYNLRNANNFTIPRCRLTLYQNSFFQPLSHRVSRSVVRGGVRHPDVNQTKNERYLGGLTGLL
jgi:hypothetical protein